MTNELLLYLSMVILPASFAVVVYFINQPYKDKRKDMSVKYISKIKVSILSILCIMLVAFTSLFFYQAWQMNGLFIKWLQYIGSDQKTNEVLSDIPSHVLEGFSQYTALMMIGFVFTIAVISYLVVFVLHICIRSIKSYLRQKQHSNYQSLLKQLKEKDIHGSIKMYYDMKQNHSKEKLYISQWEEVVRYLLLVGDIEEAETLNRYLHERYENLKYLGGTFFESKFKVALYDMEQMNIDKRKAKKVIQKTPKHIRQRENLIK